MVSSPWEACSGTPETLTNVNTTASQKQMAWLHRHLNTMGKESNCMKCPGVSLECRVIRQKPARCACFRRIGDKRVFEVGFFTLVLVAQHHRRPEPHLKVHWT